MFQRMIAFFSAVNAEFSALDSDTRAAVIDFINESTL